MTNGLACALGHVFRRGEADQRCRVVAHIIGDGEELEGGERPEDDVDLVALDQLLRLGAGAGRIAAGVGRDEIDLAPRERVALLLQEGEDSLFHLDAALRQRAGLDGEQADLERRLSVDIGRPHRRNRGAGRSQTFQDTSTMDSHIVSSLTGRLIIAASMTRFCAVR